VGSNSGFFVGSELAIEKSAVNAAHASIAKASSAVDKMRAAKSHSEFEVAWSDFLVAAGRVFTKLEQGAKASGPSKAWYGRQKHLRRKDPLLVYLHHARNVDEHGLEPVTKLKPGGVGFGSKGTTHIKHLSIQSDQSGQVSIHGETSGDPLLISVKPSMSRLVAVVDRGDKYEPPTEHLGTPITDQSPIVVADLALAFLRSLTKDAAQLT
jgi:hypothetical protein